MWKDGVNRVQCCAVRLKGSVVMALICSQVVFRGIRYQNMVEVLKIFGVIEVRRSSRSQENGSKFGTMNNAK